MARTPRSDSAAERVKRARAIGLTAAGALALALGTFAALAQLGDDAAELPIHGEMPAFDLVDHRGEPADRGDYRGGGPVIANTVFTRCPTVCPVFTMKMQEVQDRTEDLGDELRLISFTVDPSHDTPERLAEYIGDYEVDETRWTFLTGEEDDVERTVRDGLHIAMEKQGEFPSGAPDIAHNTHFILFDAELNVRGYYDSNREEEIDELIRDARRLADEG